MMTFDSLVALVLQAIASGVLIGGVYGLLAVGMSFAFGVMRIVNFAHGDLVVYGMYTGFVISSVFGIDPLWALPASFIVAAAVGSLQYQLVFRHFVGHATLQQLLAAIGCALVLQMVAQSIFGVDARAATSVFTGKYIELGPLFLSQSQIVACIVAILATLILELLLKNTVWGQAVLAVADDPEAAEIVGINSRYINIGAFALACGLAGIAGTVMVTYLPVRPSAGFLLMPIIIIATTIGGLGSIRGTFLGGLFCGVVQQITALTLNSALQDVPLYVLLLLFIAYRPTGFFGMRTE